MPRVKAIPVRREVHRFEEPLPPLNNELFQGFGELADPEEDSDGDFVEEDHVSKERSVNEAAVVDLTEERSSSERLTDETKVANIVESNQEDRSYVYLQSSLLLSDGLYRVELRDESKQWRLLQQMSIPLEEEDRSSLHEADSIRISVHKDGIFVHLHSTTVLVPVGAKIRNQLVDAFRGKDVAVQADILHGDLVLQFYVHDCSNVSLNLLQFILGKENIMKQSWSDVTLAQTTSNGAVLEFDAAEFLDELNAQSGLFGDTVLADLETQLHEQGLVTKLRQYQLEGVLWMTRVLQVQQGALPASPEHAVGCLSVQPWNQSESNLYYDITESKFITMQALNTHTHISWKSCILADSMGIGKSIQILSLCLLLRKELQDTSTAAVITAAKDEAIQFHSSHRNNAVLENEFADDFELEEEAKPCLCGRTNLTVADMGWVQCGACDKWRHIRCAGFQTAQDAEVEENYLCVPCQSIYHYYRPLASSCMLLVIPPTLVNQWQMEIKKHFSHSPDKQLSVLNITANNMFTLSPYDILKFDIVLMDFKALRTGFHTSNIDWTQRSRDSKYDVFPPSFLAIQYALMVIDETQNIESSSENQILKMACKIRAERRVSVSGTPFGNNKLHDLYNLVQFLQISPFHLDKRIWNILFENHQFPISREIRLSWLRTLFQPMVLRRTKAMVATQLQLKAGVTLLRPLKLSPFEMVLYQDNFQKVVTAFQGKAMDLSIGRAKLELLRKGCCHPEVFDKSLKSKGSLSQTGPRPLNEIMVMKVEQSKLSCEETQREQLFYLLTMAGIQLLQYQKLTMLGVEQDDHHRSPLMYLLSAMKIYKYALSLILAGRKATALIAMAQLQGEYTLLNNSNLAINESINLEWNHKSGLNYCRDVNPQASQSLDWKALHALLEEDISLPAELPGMVSSHELSNQYEVKLHFLHHKAITNITVSPFELTFDRLSADVKRLRDATSETAQELMYVFPAEGILSAAVNGADMYLNTMKIAFPFPGQSISNSTEAAISLQKNVHKSKSWRLQLSKLYNQVLVVRHTGQQLEYQWKALSCSDLCNATNTTTNQIIAVHAGVRMFESAVETDSLQELHACYNFRETLQMLDSLCKQSLESFRLISEQIVIPRDIFQLREVDHITLPQQAVVVSASSDAVELLADNIEMEVVASVATNKRKRFQSYDLLTPLKFARLLFENNRKRTTTMQNGEEEEEDSGDSWWLPSNNASQELLSEIRVQVQGIEDEFVGAAKDRKVVAVCKLNDLEQTMDSIELEILHVSNARKWWIDLLHRLENDVMFLSQLESVIDHGELAYSRLKNFRSVTGLLYILEQEFDQIVDLRKKILKYLTTLPASPSEEEIRTSADCKQCRSYFQKTGPVCRHCQFFNNFIHPYKSLHLTAAKRQSKRLVSQVKAQSSKSPGHKLGNAAAGTTETELNIKSFDEGIVDGIYIMVVKLLKAFAHKYNITQHLDITKSEVKWVEELLTEVNCMTILWDRYSELLKAFDELEQCKSRVQLIPDVGLQEVGIQYYHVNELDEAFLSNWSGGVTSENRSREVVGNLNFFKDQVQQYALEEQRRQSSVDTENSHHDDDEECIICRTGLFENEEEGAVVMLTCGHKFHHDCVSLWLKNHKKCPICKKAAHSKDLIHKCSTTMSKSIMSTQQGSADNCTVIAMSSRQSVVEAVDENYLVFRRKVVGSWGTKVDALVTDLLMLLQDPNRSEEKMIVFSQWTEMLEIVCEALKVNHIAHTLCVDRSKDFNSSRGGIELFRNNVDVRVLLMPIALGAEGLDLIIASHVFLLEPLLNYNQELQAVNRIDRIGQTKDTFVHKYVVRETIEEKVLQFQDRMRSFDHQSSATSEEASSSSTSTNIKSSAKAKKVNPRSKGDDQLLELDDIRSILNIQ